MRERLCEVINGADSHQTITCEVIAAILDLADSGAVAERDFL
jgi:hypothetical protein